eukprot:8433343-Heterocapsa_arctica.AAC.1
MKLEEVAKVQVALLAPLARSGRAVVVRQKLHRLLLDKLRERLEVLDALALFDEGVELCHHVVFRQGMGPE